MSDFERTMRQVAETLAQPVSKATVTRLTQAAEVLEGMVVEYDRTRLPQAMVECTTEYDYAVLPEHLRAALEDWCEQFNAWARSPMADYMANETATDRPE